MRNKTGIVLLIIGGILMIVSTTVGSIGFYEFLYDILVNEVPANLIPILDIALNIIRFIADWGGGAIIFGAFLIMLKQYRLGKWIISVGLAFGTLALLVWLISKIANIFITDPQILSYLANLKGFFTYGTAFQFVGVVVVILGRNFVKKPKKEKEEEDEERLIKEGEETESTQQPPEGSKFCPSCGSLVDWGANFCNECGTTFDR
ncbi:MAG: zinc ribbon domain-containing protein [Promethearchaeota archaeon]|jgi:hypothetical protein